AGLGRHGTRGQEPRRWDRRRNSGDESQDTGPARGSAPSRLDTALEWFPCRSGFGLNVSNQPAGRATLRQTFVKSLTSRRFASNVLARPATIPRHGRGSAGARKRLQGTMAGRRRAVNRRVLMIAAMLVAVVGLSSASAQPGAPSSERFVLTGIV